MHAPEKNNSWQHGLWNCKIIQEQLVLILVRNWLKLGHGKVIL